MAVCSYSPFNILSSDRLKSFFYPDAKKIFNIFLPRYVCVVTHVRCQMEYFMQSHYKVTSSNIFISSKLSHGMSSKTVLPLSTHMKFCQSVFIIFQIKWELEFVWGCSTKKGLVFIYIGSFTNLGRFNYFGITRKL